MAVSMGLAGSLGSCSHSSGSSSSWLRGRKKGSRGSGARCAAAAGSLYDQYRTLRIQPGASEVEVKKAFRKLALQYHPDVCKGNNCGVQFHRINEAYDVVMSALKEPEEEEEPWQSSAKWTDDDDEQMRGMCDPTWDLWEEWMGWEGAGIRDYSSHINPYI